ncbi:hypothetical protein [Halarsenatibacter silvermanii]|uniref:HprK-related kinase B n=1 Tax=Halarsenatibacter silvermanii TaxID=321763 RepID=A0A1G9SBZ1_9FIRM|nr:hypothetical protein [Halarsenatibacter silvermanii]SDM32315.1 hypothetical protein SAMN04488692_12715 [Halarsenatibacter silvermanii]
MKEKININEKAGFILNDFPWTEEWKQELGDLQEVVQQKGDIKEGSIEVNYKNRIKSKNMTKIRDGVYIDENSILDKRYGVKLIRDKNKVKFILDNIALEWLDWIKQLSLLKSGMTLVHASAVEKNGKALVFPSWGGVGKTSIASYLVKNKGYNLLGDDQIIISRGGMCYSMPMRLVIYPYHKDVFPELFEQGKGPILPESMINFFDFIGKKLIKPLAKKNSDLLQKLREKNPQSLKVKPSEVFGINKISYKAELEKVVWVDKGENSRPQTDSDIKVKNRLFGCTINDFDSYCQEIINIGMGLDIFENIYCIWGDVLNKGVNEEVKRRKLVLPESCNYKELQKKINESLYQ